jgi:hypothetical protein
MAGRTTSIEDQSFHSLKVRLGGMLKHNKKNYRRNRLSRYFAIHISHKPLITTRLSPEIFQQHLPKPRCATAHDFALADKFGIELRSVECEVDVEVDAVKGTLGRVHAFKVFFEVLPGKVRG